MAIIKTTDGLHIIKILSCFLHVCIVDSRINICSMYMVHDTTIVVFCLKRKHPGSSVNAIAGSEEGRGEGTVQSINQGWFFKLSLHLKNIYALNVIKR